MDPDTPPPPSHMRKRLSHNLEALRLSSVDDPAEPSPGAGPSRIYVEGILSPRYGGASLSGSDASDSGASASDLPLSPASLYENTRRYLTPTSLSPADDVEQTRLAIVHQVYLALFSNRLTLTPIQPYGPLFNLPSTPTTPTSPIPRYNSPHLRILDVGTGPGYWAASFASLFPSSDVIATDLGIWPHWLSPSAPTSPPLSPTSPGSPSAPRRSAGPELPPNLVFGLSDVRDDEWEFEADTFDLVHVRGLAGSLTAPEWATLYTRAFQSLVSGGWIEILDEAVGVVRYGETNGEGETIMHGTTTETGAAAGEPSTSTHDDLPKFSALITAIRAAARQAGRPLDLAHIAAEPLRRAGFVDVQEVTRWVPLSTGQHREPSIPLSPEITTSPTPEPPVVDPITSKMALVAALEGLESISLRPLTRDAGWAADDVLDACRAAGGELRAAVNGPQWKPYSVLVRGVFARRPPEARGGEETETTATTTGPEDEGEESGVEDDADVDTETEGATARRKGRRKRKRRKKKKGKAVEGEGTQKEAGQSEGGPA